VLGAPASVEVGLSKASVPVAAGDVAKANPASVLAADSATLLYSVSTLFLAAVSHCYARTTFLSYAINMICCWHAVLLDEYVHCVVSQTLMGS
jgi:hypothetical protein